MIALAVVAVFIGAAAQRVSGLGFALVAAPALALLLGPQEGVLLVNLLALAVSCSVLLTSIRDVDRRPAMILVPFGLLGVLPGVLAVRMLPTGPLQVAMAVLLLLGLGAVWIGKHVVMCRNARTSAGFGFLSGFMTATSGTGGPALTIYALGTSWPPRTFAATVQLSFTTQNATAVIAKGPPAITSAEFVTYLASIAAGLLAGSIVRPRIQEDSARFLVLLLALASSAALLARGLWTIVV